MKLKLPGFFAIILLGFLCLLFLGSNKTQAGTLLQTSIRLDRLKASTSTGGMVCAKTPASDNGSEAKVKITFPADFTVNSTASNWTVTTTNLPDSSTAWPGIDTATTVSGQSVTFPSSNLSSNTYYCFNFSSSNTLTTGPAGEATGTVETLTSGNTAIDSNVVAINTISNDQITVSATVPANPADFSANLALSTPGSKFRQDTILEYEISYASTLSTTSDITIEAQWSLGTISGSSTPSVDILDYVIGSASNAYNSTPPVIDLNNRTITWTISSYPANTSNQKVYFHLKTNDSYTGTSDVDFTVTGRLLSGSVTTADSSITKTYQFNYSAPAATSTPGPAATSTPTPVPGKTVKTSPLSFTNVSIDEVTQDTATIAIETSQATSLQFQYGTSIKNISKTINSVNRVKKHIVKLEGLDPDTNYYFLAEATDANGKKITTDIFTFKTALVSQIPKIDKNSLIVTNNSNVIFTRIETEEQKTSKAVVIPQNTTYEFRFTLQKNESVKSIHAFIRKKDVLGLNTFEKPTALKSDNVEVTEISPGVYVGRLVTESLSGEYELYVKINDFNGNIVEEKIAEIKVVSPFRVFSKATKQPIEDAKITLSIYNYRTRTYNLISPQAMAIKNPAYTDYQGILDLTLPQGKYKAEIESFGFLKHSVEFEINPSKKESYPQAYLEKEPFSLLITGKYFSKITGDLYTAISDFVDNLSLSMRFFDFIAATSLALLVTISIFSFSLRTHIQLKIMPLFLWSHLKQVFTGKKMKKFITGQILDEVSGKPISRAEVYLIDAHSNSILSANLSNKLGEFYLPLKDAKEYKLTIVKKGYHTISHHGYNKDALIYDNLQFVLLKYEDNPPFTLITVLKDFAENIVGFSFETILFLSLFFEFMFVGKMGLYKTLPFVLVSFITLLLWLAYAHKKIKRFASGE